MAEREEEIRKRLENGVECGDDDVRYLLDLAKTLRQWLAGCHARLKPDCGCCSCREFRPNGEPPDEYCDRLIHGTAIARLPETLPELEGKDG